MANFGGLSPLSALEAEVERLKRDRPIIMAAKRPWWGKIRGTFKDDPEYDEAMRLGREWRTSQRQECDENA